ncbi:MAG: phosphodiester glycosidase family protein [Bacteroidales bacterium]|nr:phosphodiester glycosidase family protein [Bacteroidales bacterium]
MKLTTLLAAVQAVMILFASCDKKHQSRVPDWPWEDPEVQKDTAKPVDPVVPEVSTDWTDVSADYEGLPAYVKIFKSPSTLQNRKAIAFIADVDLSKGGFSVWGLNDPGLQGTTDALKTPSQVYSAEGNPAVVINGGYFYSSGGKNYPASLAVSGGKLLSPNINYASQDWVKIYYPTRAVFLQHEDGTYEAAWSYYKSSTEHWVYQQPADNSYAKDPLQAPSATFPVKGEQLEAVNGIGGGPVLIKGGEIKNTYIEEMYDSGGINPTSPNNPRTAIGITSENHLVLFACEGREQTEGVVGFTTEELANILLDYGCVEAINLDGGGSSMMLVCGKELFKPSDGNQRKVGSCIYIK